MRMCVLRVFIRAWVGARVRGETRAGGTEAAERAFFTRASDRGRRTVVKVVEVGAAGRKVEAVVPGDWRDIGVDLVEEKVHGVKGVTRNQADQRARVVNQMLNRVHR